MIQPVLLGITFNLPCRIKQDKEAGVFVSHCPALDVYSQGRNIDEAKEALRSALRLFIAASYEQETLEHTLKSHGFNLAPAGSLPQEKEFISLAEGLVEEFDIDVPLSLISEESRACRQ
jgi:predicted RNase H-like HicB family nuclease